jgi:enoyl-CoA hydratase/carnithine racemase
LEANYVRLGTGAGPSPEQALRLGFAERESIEADEARRLAEELMRRLPIDDKGMISLLEGGWEIARQICWEQVVQRLFLPAIQEIVEADVLQ